MNFSQLITTRYSVRKFKDQSVEKEKLDIILEAARSVPTAGNRQPHRVLVIDNKEGLKKVDLCTPYRFDAPVVFLIVYDKTECWTRKFDGEPSGLMDASIVTTQMLLQATDIGLGTTWIMFFDPAKVAAEFKVPEKLVPVAFLILGYPADDAVPAVQHSQRHPLEKIVYYHDFSNYDVPEEA